jgi:lysozyme
LDAVHEHVDVDLLQSQFDALVLFVFNVGSGAFADSTLLKEVNAGRHEYVARELTRWVHAGGKPLKGLARRRVAEASLYLND